MYTNQLDPRQGPLIPVQITVNSALREYLERQSLPVPMPVDTLGLIDTGAAFSAIAPGIAQKLSLKQQGRQPVMAVGDKTQSFQPVFYGGLLLDDGHAYDTTLTEVELAFDKRIAVLIGRDILAFYELTYNGVRKEFSLTAQN